MNTTQQDLITEIAILKHRITTLKAVNACKERAINKKAATSLTALEMGAPRIAVAIERLQDIIKITDK